MNFVRSVEILDQADSLSWIYVDAHLTRPSILPICREPNYNIQYIPGLGKRRQLGVRASFQLMKTGSAYHQPLQPFKSLQVTLSHALEVSPLRRDSVETAIPLRMQCLSAVHSDPIR